MRNPRSWFQIDIRREGGPQHLAETSYSSLSRATRLENGVLAHGKDVGKLPDVLSEAGRVGWS